MRGLEKSGAPSSHFRQKKDLNIDGGIKEDHLSVGEVLLYLRPLKRRGQKPLIRGAGCP